MHPRPFVLWLLVATAIVAALPSDAFAQVLRRNRAVERTPATTPPADTGQVDTNRDLRQQAPLRRQSEILRSSKIVGIEVLDRDNQQIGTVQDVLINYQGRCPVVFATITAADNSYVVPLTVLQFAPLDPSGRTRATIAMRLDELRNAPRLEGGNVNLLGDGRFLSRVGQFFDRIERSAARMPLDGRVDVQSDSRTQPPPAPRSGDIHGDQRGGTTLQRREDVRRDEIQRQDNTPSRQGAERDNVPSPPADPKDLEQKKDVDQKDTGRQ